MKKIGLILLLAAVLCLSFAACGNDKDKGTVTLTVWGAQEDQAILKEMCEAFQKENPDTTYRFVYGVQSEQFMADTILNDVTAGPDVYSFPSDQINKLYAGGALARVGGEGEKTVKEQNTEQSVDAATVTVGGEDRLYAYPMTGDNCYIVYYDKRVFSNADDLSTLDKMLDKAESQGKKVHFKLHDDGFYLSSFFFADPSLKYQVTYTDNMVEDRVTINYDDPAGMDVMRALKHYVYDRNGLEVKTDDSKIVAAFTENSGGKLSAAAAITGTWNAAILKEKLGENLGMCKLPTAKIGNEETQLSGFMGYKLMGVNGYSKHKNEAHKLAAYLTNRENQLKRFEKRGMGPTNKEVAEMDKVKNDPVMGTVLEQAQYNRVQKNVSTSYWSSTKALLTPMITAKETGAPVTDAQLEMWLRDMCNQIRK